jgi:hypothetical protein
MLRLGDWRLFRGGEMKKRKRARRKVDRQPTVAKATAQGGNAAKFDRVTPLTELDFKPIEIRGEPLSVTVLRDRR